MNDVTTRLTYLASRVKLLLSYSPHCEIAHTINHKPINTDEDLVANNAKHPIPRKRLNMKNLLIDNRY